MARKLQRKFIMITGMAVIIMMVCFLAPLNLINYYRVGSQLQKTLRYIIESNGNIISYGETEADPDENWLDIVTNLWDNSGTVNFTLESRYQLRYFLITFDKEGQITEVSLSHIASVDREDAVSLARKYYRKRIDHGFLKQYENNYYFLQVETAGDEAIIGFLDCTRELENLATFYYTSIGFAILMVVILLGLIAGLSKWAMRPYINNMESQREFITNAGHELKTPLAIISADTEVIEMMHGKNEWTESIMSQVKRGTSLINELITLSRTMESEDVVLSDIDFSKTAKESADSFRPLIEQQGKQLNEDIAKQVVVKAEQKMLTELMNILIDNASKYCDDGGTVRVVLRKRGRAGAVLSVSNDYVRGEKEDYGRYFQRFYRGDTSHNSRKSGYGIGLSMAQTVVDKLKGNISARWKDGVIIFTVTF